MEYAVPLESCYIPMGTYTLDSIKILTRMALAKWLTSLVRLMKANGKMTGRMAKADSRLLHLQEICLPFMLENSRKTRKAARDDYSIQSNKKFMMEIGLMTRKMAKVQSLS